MVIFHSFWYVYQRVVDPNASTPLVFRDQVVRATAAMAATETARATATGATKAGTASATAATDATGATGATDGGRRIVWKPSLVDPSHTPGSPRFL